MKSLDKVLMIVGTFVLLFTMTMIIIFCVKGSIPDTLVTSVFFAAGFEGGVCGWIKNSKERIQDRRWARQDRKANNDQ